MRHCLCRLAARRDRPVTRSGATAGLLVQHATWRVKLFKVRVPRQERSRGIVHRPHCAAPRASHFAGTAKLTRYDVAVAGELAGQQPNNSFKRMPLHSSSQNHAVPGGTA